MAVPIEFGKLQVPSVVCVIENEFESAQPIYLRLWDCAVPLSGRVILGSAGCQPAISGSLPETHNSLGAGWQPASAGWQPALPRSNSSPNEANVKALRSRNVHAVPSK